MLAHKWGHALHLSVVQGSVPCVELTQLQRLEHIRISRRFRSFDSNQETLTHTKKKKPCQL